VSVDLHGGGHPSHQADAIRHPIDVDAYRHALRKPDPGEDRIYRGKSRLISDDFWRSVSASKNSVPGRPGLCAKSDHTCAHNFDFWATVVFDLGPMLQLFRIESERLKLSAPFIKVWIKQSPRSGGDESPYNVLGVELNCRANQIRTVSSANYDAGGQIIGSREGGRWGSVFPETMGEMLYNGRSN
jgi:hypothetical protein